mmetsp:Transcript_14838/g.52026  ORF Transcript_14838/g.52026 Transcript_14838/m.52026 type:complete len:409 (+) Transcript_14838:358-1584(+)
MLRLGHGLGVHARPARRRHCCRLQLLRGVPCRAGPWPPGTLRLVGGHGGGGAVHRHARFCRPERRGLQAEEPRRQPEPVRRAGRRVCRRGRWARRWSHLRCRLQPCGGSRHRYLELRLRQGVATMCGIHGVASVGLHRGRALVQTHSARGSGAREDDLSESQLAIYQPSLATKLASEFLGTFALVLSVGLNILGKSAATAWSAAATLMCMVIALGDVSGAHFNPAVTLALVLSNKGGCSLRDGFLYVVFQLTAAVLAGVCYFGLYNKQSIALGPQAGSSDNAAYFIEFVFTFVLAFVVLATAGVKGISSPLPRTYYLALAIGACVTAGGFAGGDVSGGVLNPAVAFGLAVPDVALSGGRMCYCVLYSLFQLLAGASASLMFIGTHASEFAAKPARSTPLFVPSPDHGY